MKLPLGILVFLITFERSVMKRVVYITSIAFTFFLISCDKTEFDELYEQEVQSEQQEEKTLLTTGEEVEENTFENQSVSVASRSLESVARGKDKKKNIGVSIKEVSDGDEEADDGDDAQINE